jgi:hypothetical protein
MRGPSSRIQIGGFLMKQECANTHKKHTKTWLKYKLSYYGFVLRLQGKEAENASKDRTTVEVSHFSGSVQLNVKDTHLTLEVKIFFDNSTPATGSSKESSTQRLDFPLMVINDIAEREERRNLHTTVIKQSLSDYAHQDWPDVTKRSNF